MRIALRVDQRFCCEGVDIEGHDDGTFDGSVRYRNS